MKKLTCLMMIAFAVYALQSCNSTPKDAKESADSLNKSKDTTTNVAATGGIAVTPKDSKFATAAAEGGIAEIELSKLAQQKTADAQIKSFAATMVTDHSKAGDSLSVVAKKKNITLPNTMDADHQKKFDDLNKLTGADFDKAYVKTMIDDHKGALKLMRDEAKDGDDADVKAFATKTAPIVQMHLDAINKIHDSMK